MTIRKTLLLAFLLVGALPAALLALLAFNKASSAVQAEIEHGLVAQAEAVASDVNKLMYERLQNAATWSHLEVMQDLQVGDVDKRLSSFLQRLDHGYAGLYRELSAVNRQAQVVASSQTAHIGEAAPELRPWQTLSLGADQIRLALPATSSAAGSTALILQTPVASAFGGPPLGELRLAFEGAQIDRLLDQAAGTRRMLALLDGQGRLVASSAALQALLPRWSPLLADWGRQPGSALVQGQAPLPATPMYVGVGRARGFGGFEGFGWSVLVLVPRAEALAPVQAMAGIFALILAGVALATLVVAGGVSQAIARPIVQLTDFIRSHRKQGGLPPPPRSRSAEVGELRDAFVQMVHDIDQSQQKLARASALAAVGEMSAVIAHEIRTPLGIVHSSSQILQREAQLSSEGRELASFIESETTRLNRLVSSMLDAARPRPPRFAPADLNELVTHAVALLSAQATKQGVQFTTRLHAADPALSCDAEQLTQVLLNLILNGLQILAQGGRIEISTRDEGAQLFIDIADDGPGIAAEVRERIFEAFFFQREGGVGLGLAVVQKIVLAHGGDVQAGASALGGALFSVRLPRQPYEAS